MAEKKKRGGNNGLYMMMSKWDKKVNWMRKIKEDGIYKDLNLNVWLVDKKYYVYQCILFSAEKWKKNIDLTTKIVNDKKSWNLYIGKFLKVRNSTKIGFIFCIFFLDKILKWVRSAEQQMEKEKYYLNYSKV